MIRASINGIKAEFGKGTTVLAAARKLGFDIPTLCNDDRLNPVGACRMCLVEIKGSSKETVSCTTPLADGMEVLTHSEPVEDARKWNLRMLAGNYPADAFASYPEKPFHKLARKYGLTNADFNGDHSITADASQTYINVDMSR